MKYITLSALFFFALSSSITPVPNFNLFQLAQGSYSMYINWYIYTVYDTTHNWNQDVCNVVSFMFGDNWGLMTNVTTYLDSEDGWYSGETPLYWDVNQESVLYSDPSHNQEAFFVANWTIDFEIGLETNRAILARDNGQGGYTILALQSLEYLGGSWDITPWLQAHSINPILNTNYFYLDNWCFVDAPSPVWNIFKNTSAWLGSWNVLAVYDPANIESWNQTNCTNFTFSNSENNLYNFMYSFNDENGSQSVGNWNLVPDDANATVLVGFYFGNETSHHTVMQVFYYDALGNIAIVDNQICFAAFLSKKASSMDKVYLKIFQKYLNLYGAACPIENREAYFYPNNENCNSSANSFSIKN